MVRTSPYTVPEADRLVKRAGQYAASAANSAQVAQSATGSLDDVASEVRGYRDEVQADLEEVQGIQDSVSTAVNQAQSYRDQSQTAASTATSQASSAASSASSASQARQESEDAAEISIEARDEALSAAATASQRTWSADSEIELDSLNANIGDQASVVDVGLFELTESGWVQQDASNQRVTTSTGTQPVAEALDRRGVRFTALRAPTSGTFDPEDYLETSTKVTEGLDCYTLGYYEKGDGGANDYTLVAGGTGTNDGGSFIDLTGSGLQAKGLFKSGFVYVNQFGADPSVADNTDEIKAACAYQALSELHWEEGTYTALGNIEGFRLVRHLGVATISMSDGSYRLTNSGSSLNTLYVSPNGLSTNDGLSESTALDTVTSAIRFLERNNHNDNGNFKIKVLAGNYSGSLYMQTSTTNVPVFKNSILIEGDYSGTYPNFTHNTVFTGNGVRAQDFFDIQDGDGIRIKIHGIAINNYSRAHEHWGGGVTEMRYCYIDDCDFATSCQGRVDIDFRYNVINDVDRAGLHSYSSRCAIYYNKLTNCENGFQVSRVSSAHVDYCDFDNVNIAVQADLNSRVNAIGNKFRATNIAHLASSGGIIVDTDADYGVIGVDTLQTVVVAGLGQNLRYNGYDGTREHIQDVWAASRSVTGGATLELVSSVGAQTDDTIITIPAGVFGTRFGSFTVEISGSSTYGGAKNRLEIDVLGQTYGIDLPSTEAGGKAFKFSATFYSSDSGFSDVFNRVNESTTGAYDMTVIQDGQPCAAAFGVWSNQASIRSNTISVKGRVISGGGTVFLRRVVGKIT